MNNEQFRAIWRTDALKEVHEEIDDGYRHGNYVWTIFQHGDDFWSASYTVSGDGEEHGLRDGHFELEKVYPVTKTVTTTDYVSTPQKPKPPTRYRRKYHEVEAIQFPGLPTAFDVLESLNAKFDEMDKFEAWIDVNAGDIKFKYRGSNLIMVYDVFEDEVPPGDWIIKEPGRDPYPMSAESFPDYFEKA